MSDKKMMKVTLTRSMYGRKKGHIECVKGLGIRRMRHSVTVEDTPSTRGMVNKVYYMVQVEEA